MNNNLPAFSAALASYHVSEAVPGLAHGVFHVQQNFPASSIDAVMSALASAVDNKMEVQRDSFRRFNNDKYSFVASVVMAAKDEVQDLARVPQSFVAVAKNDGVNISARSMGALNVQVILEPLGGGGHLMMAGAQLQNCTLQDAEHRIREQIDLYRAAQKENTAR